MKTTSLDSIVIVEAAYGRALLSAHALERGVGSLLITNLGRSKLSGLALDEAIEKIKRLTLGPLIERFIQEFKVNDALEEELDNMLYFRNELAHRISDMVLTKAAERGWRRRLARELLEISSYFREAVNMLDEYVDAYLHSIGVPRERLMEIGCMLYPGIADVLAGPVPKLVAESPALLDKN